MKNTKNFDFNNKDFQEVTAKVMADLKANNVKCDTKDDIYAAMSRYVQVSREDFESLYQQVKEKEASVKESAELNEMELDAVVGGLPDFFKSGWGVATVLIASALIITGVGAGLGAVLGGVGLFSASGAAAGAAAGAICAVPGSIIATNMFYSLAE